MKQIGRMNALKNAIKRAVNRAGFSLLRLNPASSPSYQLLQTLRRLEVDLVLDVGANIGQFASELRSAGYHGEIVSFEPLSDAHRVLSQASSRDPHWRVHPRCAIGDRDGETQINVAGNSVSSSVLGMMDAHLTAAPDSAYVRVERASIVSLDTVAPQYLKNARSAFLKIDSQGYEWQVLDGAHRTLQRLNGVMCELALVPLYKGQRLWVDLIERLEGVGFVLWSLREGFIDVRDGRTLQVDGVFVRTSGNEQPRTNL